MEITAGEFSALIQVIIVDLVLAGDNAVVVGMAAAGLPREQRKQVIFIGIAAATLMRVGFALVTVQLLQIIGLVLAGGVLLLWVSWITNRIHPCDPRVSPVRGDLSGLPPTLVHASEAEMLLDDARRYVNKATEAGSEATLESWHHMLHVWHIFDERLPEAAEAFAHIGRFIELTSPTAHSPAEPESAQQ